MVDLPRDLIVSSKPLMEVMTMMRMTRRKSWRSPRRVPRRNWVSAKILWEELDLTPTIDHLKKKWTAPIYAFFKPDLMIDKRDGKQFHIFHCNALHCKRRTCFV